VQAVPPVEYNSSWQSALLPNQFSLIFQENPEIRRALIISDKYFSIYIQLVLFCPITLTEFPSSDEASSGKCIKTIITFNPFGIFKEVI